MEPLPEKKQQQHRDNGGRRNRNPRSATVQNQSVGSTPESEPELKPEPVPEKKQHRDNGGHRNRNPRLNTDQKQTGGSSPEPVPEKKQHGHWSRKQEVSEPKGKTAPLAQNVGNDGSGGDGVAAAVEKEVNVSNVSRSTNGRYGSGGYNKNRPARPPFPVKRPQVTAVWVKKGASAPN
ncbi:uncharacterized protein LOC143636160 [Bidens hawaiensis]|uniref:uncharacterized protein LOC143609758 n=1 Tax=Bidens hawaiensis TaxID=980011 RepID=UPI00404AA9E5